MLSVSLSAGLLKVNPSFSYGEISHAAAPVNFTSASSHVPAMPGPPLILFHFTSKSEVEPSGRVEVPLMVCVFPSSETACIIVLRTRPSFLITISQLFVPSGVMDIVCPYFTGWSVPSNAIVSVSLPVVHLYLLLPRSSILLCSPVSMLFFMLSFHLPQKGSSPAQRVAVIRQANAKI